MLTDKKFQKIEKQLGKETLAKIESLSSIDLKQAVVTSESAIKQAQDELAANPKYQELKESITALRSGMSDVKKRQSSIIEYCLHLLEEKGEK